MHTNVHSSPKLEIIQMFINKRTDELWWNTTEHFSKGYIFAPCNNRDESHRHKVKKPGTRDHAECFGVFKVPEEAEVICTNRGQDRGYLGEISKLGATLGSLLRH